MAQTMRAARLVEPGKPFRVDTVPIPEPRPDEVRIRVAASAVIPNMKAVMSGQHWYVLPKPPATVGLDTTGTVEKPGAQVADFAPGERVYVNPALNCGTCHYCLHGQSARCVQLALMGYFGVGPRSAELLARYPHAGFADYMIAPARNLVRLPKNVSFEQGARWGYLGTSYAALRAAGCGHTTAVVINGATGTVGVGAVLLALAMGAPRVLAVARNETILAKLAALAPGRVATRTLAEGGLTEWVRAQTGGVGAEILVDCQGRAANTESTQAIVKGLAKGGWAVVVGAVPGKLDFDYVWFLVNEVRLTGSIWFTTAQGAEMATMAAGGTLDLGALEPKPFALERVNEALDFAAGRPGGFTNVVVRP